MVTFPTTMPVDLLDIETQIRSGQPLAPLTTLGVGGAAQYYLVVEDVESLVAACRWARKKNLPLWVLAGGSNLVVSDQGVAGLTIDLRLSGCEFDVRAEEELVTAAAGEGWDELVASTAKRGLFGIECLSGIPGRVGATPIQNVGAYGQEVSQTIVQVSAYDRHEDKIQQFEGDACEFGYRTSLFRHRLPGRFVLLSVTFRLSRMQRVPLRSEELMRRLSQKAIEHPQPTDVRAAVLEVRRSKSMVYDVADPWSHSCGSFFVNPVVSSAHAASIEAQFADQTVPFFSQSDGTTKIAAAWLIEKAGFLRGHQEGLVGLSPRHSLAIVAQPRARAEDVCLLARKIQNRVFERFGVRLTPEPAFWGFSHWADAIPECSP